MNPDLTLPTSLFNRSVVYGWRRGEKYLYIGQTKSLLKRLAGHHKVGLILDFEETDNLDLWFCESKDLLTLEESLIRLYQPTYNGDWESRASESIRKYKKEVRGSKAAFTRLQTEARDKKRMAARNRYIRDTLGRARYSFLHGDKQNFYRLTNLVRDRFPSYDMDTWLKNFSHEV
jgi:hypothetical protein